MSDGRTLKVTVLGDDASLQKVFHSTQEATEKTATVMEGAAKQVEHLKEALMGLFGITAVGFGLEKVITDAQDFTTNVQRMTAALNGDAIAGSEWVAVAEKMGLETTMLSRAFSNVSKEAETGKGALVQMGIATLDSSGHLRSMNDILMDAVDWFHQNAGSTNEATYAQQIFGKSSGQILALLQQGRAGFAAIAEEAKTYGLVINNDVLEHQLAMSYQLKAAQEAVHGLAVNLGEALMPAVAALGQGLSNFIATHLQQFINSVNAAVSWVIGLGEAFGFWDASMANSLAALSATTQATGDYGTNADTAASSAKGLAEATKAIRDAAKDATQAIDEQTRGIDAQIKSLQDAQKSAAFDAKQTAIKQQEADKQKQIDDLKITKAYQVWSGNLSAAQTTQEKIDTLNSEIAKLEIQYNQNASAEVVADKIDSLNQQKAVLAEHKRSIQDVAQSQIEAMQQANTATVAAARTAAVSIPPLMDQAAKDAAEKYRFAMVSTAETTGKQFGDSLILGLTGAEPLDQWDKLENNQTKTMQDRSIKWERVGKTLGKAISDGIQQALSDSLANSVSDALGQVALRIHFGSGLPASDLAALWRSLFGGSPPPAAPPAAPAVPADTPPPPTGSASPAPTTSLAHIAAGIAQTNEHLAAIRYASGDSVYGQVAVIHTGG